MTKAGWIDRQDKVRLDIGSGGVAVRVKKTGQEVLGVHFFQDKIPSWFPKDFPIFHPSTAWGSTVLGPTKAILMTADAPLEEVLAYYQKEMVANGWSEEPSSKDQDFHKMTFKKDRRVATIEVSPTKKGGTGSLNLTVFDEDFMEQSLERLEGAESANSLNKVFEKADAVLEQCEEEGKDKEVCMRLLKESFNRAAARARKDLETEGEKPFSPQATFGLEAKMDSPVKLSNDVLEILKADERSQDCLQRDGLHDVPATWFEASEIDLNTDGLQDIIVKPEYACLWGANIGPFWVFLNTSGGHRLVLETNSLGIDVLKTKSHGVFDIHAVKASAVELFHDVFKFNGERYELKKYWTETLSDE